MNDDVTLARNENLGCEEESTYEKKTPVLEYISDFIQLSLIQCALFFSPSPTNKTLYYCSHRSSGCVSRRKALL
jgi:hypothetical protein